MADFHFVADSTMPGLCASDLTRRSGGHALEAPYSKTASIKGKSRWSRIFDLRILRDLGLDRGAC
jgi:hypothetical protein